VPLLTTEQSRVGLDAALKHEKSGFALERTGVWVNLEHRKNEPAIVDWLIALGLGGAVGSPRVGIRVERG
jgi:hypothetical protein